MTRTTDQKFSSLRCQHKRDRTFSLPLIRLRTAAEADSRCRERQRKCVWCRKIDVVRVEIVRNANRDHRVRQRILRRNHRQLISACTGNEKPPVLFVASKRRLVNWGKLRSLNPHKRIPNARTESTPRNRRATALPSPTASISRRHSRRVATSCTNIWCIRERTVWKTNKRTSGSRNNLDRSQGQPPIGPPDHAATKGPAGAFLLELPRNYWSYEFHESTESDQPKASTYLKRWPRLLEGKPSLAPRRRSWAVNATTPVRQSECTQSGDGGSVSA